MCLVVNEDILDVGAREVLEVYIFYGESTLSIPLF